jgi:hypothetical protein
MRDTAPSDVEDEINLIADLYDDYVGTFEDAASEGQDELDTAIEDFIAEFNDDELSEATAVLDDFWADECGIDDGGSSETTLPDDETSSGDFGTRDRPLKLGTLVETGDWELTVTAYDPNGFGQIAAINEFATAPAPPNGVGIVNVQFTYVGDDSSSPGYDFSPSLLLSSNTTVSTGEDPCYYLDTNGAYDDLFPGGSASVPYCFVTDSAELVAKPVLILEFYDPNTFESTKIFLGLA